MKQKCMSDFVHKNKAFPQETGSKLICSKISLYDCLVVRETSTTSTKPKKRFRQIDNDQHDSHTGSRAVYCTSEFHISINSMKLNRSIIMSTVKFMNEII